jgi:alkylation response protein AidB-like acyl-CoA dehydrogenase
MDDGLTSEHREIREQARKFARERLGPIASEIDEKETFPREVYAEMGRLGFIGAAFPEQYGGGGADLLTNALIKEELGVISPGFAMSVGTSAIFFAYNVLAFGTEEQKKRYIPPILRGEKIGSWCLTEPGSGSDALSISTRSVRKGREWIINGSKTFITNAPIADFFIVVTRTDGRWIEGGTTFLLDRDTKGLSVSKPFKKLGMRCSPTAEVILEDVKIDDGAVLGEPGRGFRDMMISLDSERATAPITSIAIARACLELSRDYASKRHQFGQSIAEFQLIQQKLADMAMGIALARTYAYKVIQMKMAGEDIRFEVAMAKRFAAQMAQRAAADAVQIFGGYGFMREFAVERFYRDVKLTDIGGGTSEIQTLIIARELLKGRNP